MAQISLVVVAILLFASATPLAHGQTVQGLNVVGSLCCTSTGNCVGGAPGVSGAPLVLNCTSVINSVVTLAQGATGATGAFNLSTTNLLGAIGSIVGGVVPCEVIVSLPLINSTVCPILNNATGVLVSLPTLVNTVLSPVFGLIANMKVSAFVNATVG